MMKEKKAEKDCREESARGKEEFMKGWKGRRKESAREELNEKKRKEKKRNGSKLEQHMKS